MYLIMHYNKLYTGCRTEDETFHQEGLIWMEDECTMCRCMQGQIFCKTQLCDVHCLRPKKQAGECCSSCDDDGMYTDTVCLLAREAIQSQSQETGKAVYSLTIMYVCKTL